MTQKININQTVYQIIAEHPDLKAHLIAMGFSPLANDKMLQTVGRMMPLKTGARQIDLPVAQLIEKLSALGYEVEE